MTAAPTAPVQAGPETTHLRTCPLCEAMCGLRITVRDGEVTGIRPHREDVFSKGHICPKGTTLGRLHSDPTRLRGPVVRDGAGFREVSWDEAFETCERLVHRVVAEHGMEAVTAYVGNPAAHTFSIGRYIGVLIGTSGIPRIYSAGTVDQWPKNVSSALMYGGMWSVPVPDIQRSDFMVLMGANPQASQGSLLACADVLGELDRIRAGGGKVIVIDPRRTGTVRHATEWIPIMPGTDAALLLAVVLVLFAEGLVDLGGLDDVVVGVDESRALSAPFTPERVAATCQLPAERIRKLAREIAAAERGVVYGRIGLCNQEFGRWHSRVRGAPEVLGQVPVSCLAEEIDTPGEGQVKALITVAGNPALSAPGAGRLQQALPLLDAMNCVDNWINETTRHAHVSLPGLSPLEQPHFDDLLWQFAVRSAGKWSEAVFPPEDGRPGEWEVLVRLAAIVSGSGPPTSTWRRWTTGSSRSWCPSTGSTPPRSWPGTSPAAPNGCSTCRCPPARGATATARTPAGSRCRPSRTIPTGLDFGPMVARVREALRTPSGKIEIAPDHITGDIPRLVARLDRPADAPVLTSRRHLRSRQRHHPYGSDDGRRHRLRAGSQSAASSARGVRGRGSRSAARRLAGPSRRDLPALRRARQSYGWPAASGRVTRGNG